MGSSRRGKLQGGGQGGSVASVRLVVRLRAVVQFHEHKGVAPPVLSCESGGFATRGGGQQRG
eukprot:6974769-Lingulodinium_polyedra.AAC.1